MLARHSRLTGHLCANHLDVHRPKHLGECVLPSGHVTPNLNPHHLSVTPPLTGCEPDMSVHSVLDVCISDSVMNSANDQKCLPAHPTFTTVSAPHKALQGQTRKVLTRRANSKDLLLRQTNSQTTPTAEEEIALPLPGSARNEFFKLGSKKMEGKTQLPGSMGTQEASSGII